MAEALRMRGREADPPNQMREEAAELKELRKELLVIQGRLKALTRSVDSALRVLRATRSRLDQQRDEILAIKSEMSLA